MRKAKWWVVALMLVLMSASATFSLPIRSYTPTPKDSAPVAFQQQDDSQRERVVSALERAQGEVKAGRKLISDYEAREKALSHQVEVLSKNNELLTENYFKAVEELAEVRAALKDEKEAVIRAEDEIKTLRAENKTLKRKLRDARIREALEMAGTALFIFLRH